MQLNKSVDSLVLSAQAPAGVWVEGVARGKRASCGADAVLIEKRPVDRYCSKTCTSAGAPLDSSIT
jgi:hypothetical protein